MRYAVGIPLLLFLDFVLFFVWIKASLEENCGNGVPRWSCGEFLQETLLPVLPYAFLVSALVTLLVLSLGLGKLATNLIRRSRRS
jgi:hypothetical protein